MIESTGLASAINLSDIMVKSANIDFEYKKLQGFGWMTVMIKGMSGRSSSDRSQSAAIGLNACLFSRLYQDQETISLMSFLPKEAQHDSLQAEQRVIDIEETANEAESSLDKATPVKSENVPVINEE
ncbi:BMC domain-containing protein [Enterococcus mundtii]|uniref:BMC domain-containing protein n=1 Tax=Enterococcus mundtii TaxID=53346 RepID=UPI0035C74597